ncbi:hypothetical protein BOTBODRAFT_176249 [Botryobasidium botryosum FD-172 SS1]|uniref:Aminoglycoside phosphotransferase domain-containing protein n=1 Tax=Botryobasidium botryosum (strain FD-172 SS1) TaxID=930990 RepID=A0A067MLU0_BOTB1|nr:hypothetical protein BOTBODRAFT_176249 [Botryobasidium botryosum FD-172 SS1]
MSSPSESAYFDFAAHLEKVVPDAKYSTTKLSGDLVNLVVRAIPHNFSDPSLLNEIGPFGVPKSSNLILKYAPPYVASIGPNAPFSQHRQTVEAASLIFLRDAWEHLEVSTTDRTHLCAAVVTPQLLHHDPENHVLILEDLGADLSSLDEWLAKVPRIETVRSAGMRLGVFLAEVHSLPMDTAASRAAVRLIQSVDSGMNELVAETAVNQISAHVKRANIRSISDSEADVLQSQVNESFLDLTLSESEKVFCIGDLWTGSVMMGTGVGEDADSVALGVIDWEFAGLGRPLQDIAQLLAHLHLQQIGSKEIPEVSNTVQAFITSLTTAYRATSIARCARWTQDAKVRTAARRVAYILHGRELINNAFERDFHFVYGDRGDGATSAERQREMVMLGARYIRGGTHLGLTVGKDDKKDDTDCGGLAIEDDILEWTMIDDE